MTGNLLPINATAFERSLADSIALDLNTEPAKGFKYDKLEPFIPWLIWEYGLEELVPWIDDLNQLIEDGVKWSRMRGTPASLRMALSWANLIVSRIEEEPPGKHFAEFQIGLRDVPNDLFVGAVVALAKLSAPARSRLMRIYNDHYDVRRFVLDDSMWGDLLSDYSGVQIDETFLSFGRKNHYGADCLCFELEDYIDRELVTLIASSDIYRLDYAVLGNTAPHLQNINSLVEHGHYYANDNGVTDNGVELDQRENFAKASIVLSEDCELGAINSCLPAYYRSEIGHTPKLDDMRLSEEIWGFERKEILERFARNRSYETTEPFDALEVSFIRIIGRSFIIDGTSYEEQTHGTEITRPLSAEYTGITKWHNHAHQNRPWTNTSPVISTSHSRA